MSRLPTATYRWQFHAGFRFSDAAVLVPYLAELGISHCYASPYLKAHPGSVHGYDISDHNAINPEVGTDQERRRFVSALKAHKLGQIIDIVPNHMAVNDENNHWWWDVLEYGERSRFAHYFDIDWKTPDREYAGKVVIPILGDQYGQILESGAIGLDFDKTRGAFIVSYYEHRLPVSPWSYPAILARIAESLPSQDDDYARMQDKLHGLMAILTEEEQSVAKGITGTGPRIAVVQAQKEIADCFACWPVCESALHDALAYFNGATGEDKGRFDPLHALLEKQAYRLAFWRVSSCEINYRRFFDINDLAALRMEDAEVFSASHALIGSWLAAGDVTGLRVDHPDGLRDPEEYFGRLNAWARCLRPDSVGVVPRDVRRQARELSVYLVGEKILGTHETLPESWRVHGTTGYDFTNLVCGILIDALGEEGLERTYESFVGSRDHYPDMLYECKKLIMHTSLASEIHGLGIRLEHIAELDRRTRDFTRSAQMSALFEIVAFFPVYRTYISERGVSASDRRYIEAACTAAKARNESIESEVVDFIQSVLLLEGLDGQSPGYRRDVLDCVAAFQQYTAPVMAKGLEDTLFYRYNRFVALNEVGGDPSQFSVSLETFHERNHARLRDWPYTMLCTSSHDTKRSEDVRARLNVLSEIPELWGAWVLGLKERYRDLKSIGEPVAPSARDEYLFYQSLVGIWPLDPRPEGMVVEVCARLTDYMRKAVREAKIETSWIKPNPVYESAVVAFVEGMLDVARNREGILELGTWIAPVARVGLWNALSQAALKLVVPGVPDFYQGTEVWDFSLVDPDNRRPVDYAYRTALMADMVRNDNEEIGRRMAFIKALLSTPEDGRIKMYLTRTLLRARRAKPDLFAQGTYLPLMARGDRARHLVSFARCWQDQVLLVMVPRYYWELTQGGARQPLGAAVWGDTIVAGVPGVANGRFRNVFTGESVAAQEECDGGFRASDLFRDFPVAVLWAS
ncbi:MAG: malto-oligosyltrehalose synthase [Acidiferrobacter sp.]